MSIRKLLEVIIFLVFMGTTVHSQIEFTMYEIKSQAAGTQSLFCCDIDSDGDNDIIGAASEDNDVYWFENIDGGKEWKKHIVDANLWGAGTVVAGDLDNDGLLDIVAGGKGAHQIKWYKNNGDAPLSFSAFNLAASYDFPHEVFIEDLDQDGRPDLLAVSSTANKVSWFKNEVGIQNLWIEYTIGTNFTQAKSVSAGDFDNDGLIDVVATSLLDNEITLWKNIGGTPIEWKEVPITKSFYGAHRVQSVDMDHDGDLDLLAAAWYGNMVSWYRNDGGDPIEWKKHDIVKNYIRTCIAYAVDIDNDSDIDVVASSQDLGEVGLWENVGINAGTINWERKDLDLNFSRVWPVFAVDISGDNMPDVVAASGHRGINKVRWWQNNKVTSIKNTGEVPMKFELNQNFPNPFNPSTQIEFSIPKGCHVSLKIYNSIGERIETLVNKFLTSGFHTITFEASHLVTGIYLYKLQAGSYSEIKKMTLIK